MALGGGGRISPIVPLPSPEGKGERSFRHPQDRRLCFSITIAGGMVQSSVGNTSVGNRPWRKSSEIGWIQCVYPTNDRDCPCSAPAPALAGAIGLCTRGTSARACGTSRETPRPFTGVAASGGKGRKRPLKFFFRPEEMRMPSVTPGLALGVIVANSLARRG